MIEVKEYLPEHFTAIKLREVYAKEKPIPPQTALTTFLIDGEPVAIFGGYLIGVGLLQVWALLSDGIKRRPIEFHREVLAMLKWNEDKLSLRRIQMSVQVGYKEGWKWAKALGFSCEGIMKRYSPDGSDCWLFARTNDRG